MPKRQWGDNFILVAFGAIGGLIALIGFFTGKPTWQEMFPPTPKQVVALRERDIYTDPDWPYSIEYPKTWHQENSSTPDAARMRFSAANNDGTLSVLIFKRPDKLSAQQLTELLERHLDESYDQFEQYDRIEPFSQADHSIEIVGVYVVKGYDGTDIRVQINSYIEQRGDLISILKIVVREKQFAELSEPINEILSSYDLNPAASLPPLP